MNNIRKYLNFILVAIASFVGGCSYDYSYSVCAKDIVLIEKSDKEILELLKNIAKEFDLEYKGYARDFPSGAKVVTGTLLLKDKPVFSLSNQDGEDSVYSVSFYELDEGYIEKILTSLKSEWGSESLQVVEQCLKDNR